MNLFKAKKTEPAPPGSAALATRYGVLSYDQCNIGDDIQALAAFNYLPQADYFIHRDKLSQFKPASDLERVELCLNGWFLGSTHWPPAPSIRPLFVSFHAGRHQYAGDGKAAFRVLLSKASIDYLKAHEPIGCRDLPTADLLARHGVSTYFSGCLTLTLAMMDTELTHRGEGSDILFVDVDADVRKLYDDVPSHLRKDLKIVTHQYDGIGSWETAPPPLRMNTARDKLLRYCSAKLVITSRLHCALPCLAMGAPVVFIPPAHDLDRLPGLVELFDTPKMAGREIVDRIAWERPPPNPTRHRALAEALHKTCQDHFSVKAGPRP